MPIRIAVRELVGGYTELIVTLPEYRIVKSTYFDHDYDGGWISITAMSYVTSFSRAGYSVVTSPDGVYFAAVGGLPYTWRKPPYEVDKISIDGVTTGGTVVGIMHGNDEAILMKAASWAKANDNGILGHSSYCEAI